VEAGKQVNVFVAAAFTSMPAVTISNFRPMEPWRSLAASPVPTSSGPSTTPFSFTLTF
jgi:hypothetical protein